MKISQRAGLLILMAIIFGIASMIAHAGALDRKTFAGTTGKLGRKSSEKDELRFENGQFTSAGCGEYGLGASAYETTVEGDETHFVADTYSDKTGRITWVGTISGNNLEATYRWYKKGKYAEPKQIKWFKGTMTKQN